MAWNRGTGAAWAHQQEVAWAVLAGIRRGVRGFADASVVGAGKSASALNAVMHVFAWLQLRRRRRREARDGGRGGSDGGERGCDGGKAGGRGCREGGRDGSSSGRIRNASH